MLDAGAFWSTIPEPAASIEGRLVTRTGGPAGIGAAVLYPESLAFAYFTAEGARVGGPTQVIPRTTPSAGDEISISSSGSGFAIALYGAARARPKSPPPAARGRSPSRSYAETRYSTRPCPCDPGGNRSSLSNWSASEGSTAVETRMMISRQPRSLRTSATISARAASPRMRRMLSWAFACVTKSASE
jgi:hypothetical protein